MWQSSYLHYCVHHLDQDNIMCIPESTRGGHPIYCCSHGLDQGQEVVKVSSGVFGVGQEVKDKF